MAQSAPREVIDEARLLELGLKSTEPQEAGVVAACVCVVVMVVLVLVVVVVACPGVAVVVGAVGVFADVAAVVGRRGVVGVAGAGLAASLVVGGAVTDGEGAVSELEAGADGDACVCARGVVWLAAVPAVVGVVTAPPQAVSRHAAAPSHAAARSTAQPPARRAALAAHGADG